MNTTRYPMVYLIVFVTLVVSVLIASLVTDLWVLSAIPIGLLFGFCLQKGDLCGASAFSEVLLMKSWSKVWGLWVCILVSMVGFAALDLFGLVSLNVKPLIWVNYIVGGCLFGMGMVFAGGCVSGCLFKAAAGNMNSIVALVMIPTGVALVEHGPLSDFNAWMKTFVVKMPDGSSVGLPAATGIPYWVWVSIFCIATVIGLWLVHARRDKKQKPADGHRLKALFFSGWRPWQAGLAIGILAVFAYLSSAASGRNYPLGVTHGVYFTQVLATDHPVKHVLRKPESPKSASGSETKRTGTQPTKKVVWWLVFLIGGLMVGSFLSGKMSGTARLLPKPPDQMLVALFGGLFVGVGAGLAKGCVIGNIVSGWALMSVGTVLFGVVVILTNWITTYFYLMGGSIRGS